MRVLVLGAGGFIGGRIAAGLLASGHDVVPCGRDAAALRRRYPGLPVVVADLARDGAPEWLPRLAGLDAVVNAAGVLGNATLEAVHSRGPAALFDACAEVGIARLAQISALGADADAHSRFHLTKRAADEHLLHLRDAAGPAGGRTGWCVLRPSLVIGRGGRSTALFAALAALPYPLRLGPGTWRVQPVHVADLARAVTELLEAPAPIPPRLDLVGPEPMTTNDLTRVLRRWVGLREAPFLPLPAPLLRLAAGAGGAIGGGTLTRETLGMLARGNVADAGPAAAALGWQPRPLAAALAAEPAAEADRWHARLLPVRPALRLGLAVVWIGSGVVSALVTPLARSHALLAGLGVHGAAATAVTLAGAALDVVLGLALLALPRRTRLVGAAQIAAMLLFTVLATVAAPEAWADPFGPLLKNVAVLVATLALMATGE
jgi:nucleoside-diphosphate-sugar epimerase